MVTLSTLFLFSIVCLAIAMIIQSAFAIYLMVYAWDQPTEDSSAQHFIDPQTTFTLLIPARFEKRVIAQTLDAIANLNYPKSLYEVLVICRSDDEETISTVNTKLHDLSLPSFRLIEFSGYPINKPHSLNQGLSAARNNVIGVFDAEDEPHPDILQIMNTAFTKEKSDAIQGGVQLMNVSDSWYSTLSVPQSLHLLLNNLHLIHLVDLKHCA